MSELRQQILILHLASSDLASRTVAWALYDGASAEDALPMQSGDEKEPPYNSVVAAMRAGWNVIQLATLPQIIPDHEHESSYLPYEYVLERKVAING
ncbi:hypothetical protein [Dictyobacter aurantiacus]|uniref:Uncharacterized protein n=1 Tax=Dictyobacter aurantiacus TaxID=1936993 RepID=A0A401ZPA9_9CHLR|nr:hypothetical protein [Dictyobacter aurantiacus]GCE08586.1 hypothetical protein KDAU_59150 [Dictyobacter aurantiacus]